MENAEHKEDVQQPTAEDDSTIQLRLVGILTGAEGPLSPVEEFDLVSGYISASSSRTIFTLACQTLEKCCGTDSRFASKAVFRLCDALEVLHADQSDRNMKLVAAQTVARLCKHVGNSGDGHLASLVLLASRLDELQAAVGTADVVLTRSMAEACDTVRAMQPAPSEAVAPAVAAFAAAAAASAAAAAAATAAADGHETDVDDAMEPGEEADDAAADASGGAARPATAAAAAAAAAALTPAATSHNGAGGSGGVGGQLPPMSENALHKHREGVTMVFDELTSRQVEALAFLVNSFPRTRWLEIAQRLRSFYKPNVTSPVVIEKYMRLNHEAMRAFMSLAGFHCKPEHIISPDNFHKLQLVSANLCDDDYVTRATAFLTRAGATGGGPGMGDRDGGRDGDDNGRKRGRDDYDQHDDEPRRRAFDHHHPHHPPPGTGPPAHGGHGYPPYPNPHHHHHHHGGGEGYPDGPSPRNGPPPGPPGPPGQGDGWRPFVHDHDDATPSLLIRNLPPDVKIDELVTLIIKHTTCSYIEEKDIAIPPMKPPRGGFHANPDALTAETGAHAYINFHHLKDSRNAKKALDGKIFGGRTLQIEYSMGRATKVVWVGGLGPEGAVTERMLEDKMRPFGRIESIDIKRRPRHNDAFAFVVFEDIRDSQRCVKALGGATMIGPMTVRIGYSSSSKDERMGMPGSSPHGPGPSPGGPPPHAAPGGGPPGRRRSESRDRDRPRFPPGAGGGGPPYDGGGRGPPGYEGNPGQRPYPAGPGPAPGPGGGGGGGGGGGQFYSNSNSSGPPPAAARAYPNQPPSGYPSQGGARGGYPPAHSNGGGGSGGGGYAQAPASTLGGISEDEARRKDLRYLTVTRCSGEADVAFVMEECKMAGPHTVVGVSRRDFTVAVLFQRVDDALTARSEMTIRNPVLEYRLAAAPPGHGGSGDAPPQQQAAPAAAEYHDHDEDGDAVYWSASGNSNGGQWGNQQQRR